MRLVIKFAAAPGEITMLTEVLREGHPILILWHVTKPVQVTVNTGCRWTKPHHNRGPRWATQRRGAISLLEEDSFASQFVDVWCLRLGMSSKTTNPVVEIVNSDEQHIWPDHTLSRLANRQRKQGDQET